MRETAGTFFWDKEPPEYKVLMFIWGNNIQEYEHPEYKVLMFFWDLFCFRNVRNTILFILRLIAE